MSSVRPVPAGQDDRAGYADALEDARVAAFPTGEFAGQESFMRASEILDLAGRAGIGPGTRVLDLCCGVAGPGRLVTRTLGCDYLGVDRSPDALAVAREQARAAGLACRFEAGSVPPLPAGQFDVVLLLETVLAFPDKEPLLRAVAAALPPGGRFALTVEEGEPLTAAEQQVMPDADTVHLVPLPDLLAGLARAGFEVTWQAEHSALHLEVVDALTAAFVADRDRIAALVGDRVVDDLVASHRLWGDWLRSGRVRKFALVARRTGG